MVIWGEKFMQIDHPALRAPLPMRGISAVSCICGKKKPKIQNLIPKT